jgi:hypothetical protein
LNDILNEILERFRGMCYDGEGGLGGKGEEGRKRDGREREGKGVGKGRGREWNTKGSGNGRSDGIWKKRWLRYMLIKSELIR